MQPTKFYQPFKRKMYERLFGSKMIYYLTKELAEKYDENITKLAERH